jgi:hypothetical protein
MPPRQPKASVPPRHSLKPQPTLNRTDNWPITPTDYSDLVTPPISWTPDCSNDHSGRVTPLLHRSFRPITPRSRNYSGPITPTDSSALITPPIRSNYSALITPPIRSNYSALITPPIRSKELKPTGRLGRYRKHPLPVTSVDP